MTLFSAISCAEEYGTRNEDYDAESGISASVTLRCAYSDRHALAQDLLVSRRVWPFGGWAAPPRASRCGIRPILGSYTQDEQAIAYATHALVTVQYTVSRGGEDDELISESLEPSVEFITQNPARFKWTNAAGDPLLPNELAGKQRHGLVLRRTLFQVQGPLPTTLLSLNGSSNDADYTSDLLSLTFDEETLLYTLPGLSRSITMTGAKSWNLQLAFLYQPNGWNKYWRAKTGLYEPIWNDALGQIHKNYPPEDFSDFLF